MQIADLDHATRRSTEQRLNRLYKECGCRLGLLSAVVGVAVVVCGRTYGLAQGFSGIGRVLVEVTSIIATAVIGKLLGLIYARQELYRYVAALTRFPTSARNENI